MVMGVEGMNSRRRLPPATRRDRLRCALAFSAGLPGAFVSAARSASINRVVAKNRAARVARVWNGVFLQLR